MDHTITTDQTRLDHLGLDVVDRVRFEHQEVLRAQRGAQRSVVGRWCDMDAVIISFGYLHRPAPNADITVDLRTHLHDLHFDPELRLLTGLDELVREHVLVLGLHVVQGIVITVEELLRVMKRPPVTVAIGCAGGRHRSVAIAEEVAYWLRSGDWDVKICHRDIDCPVVKR